MEVRHGRLAPVGFEQLKGRPDLAPTAARPAASVYSTVQQQDYLASVWLSKKEKLEHVTVFEAEWQDCERFSDYGGLFPSGFSCEPSSDINTEHEVTIEARTVTVFEAEWQDCERFSDYGGLHFPSPKQSYVCVLKKP
ncbi:hypothetical protein SRHO_G00254880 [Serrasalmus rhombeus]